MSAPPDRSPREQLSKTPSWIMVGFVFGCLATWTVLQEVADHRNQGKPKVPAAVAPRPEPPRNTITKYEDRPSLTIIEALFAAAAEEAKWDENEVTEIEVWNQATNRFSDFFEVTRRDGSFYFRSIPQMTRPLIEPEKNGKKMIIFTQVPALR